MDRTQRWLQLAVLCALACAIGGCDDSSIFSIRMRSVAGGLERQLTARLSHEDPDSAATAARLKRVYHVGTWPDSLPFRGKALFRDTLPNDVGGFGRIAHRSSPLGESWMYLERFRGDPDPARSIESRLGAADSAATLSS